MNKSMTKMMNSALIKLPSPTNISYLWNYGSLLGLMLFIQLTSGMILSMHYCPNINEAFNSMTHIMQNVNNGWLLHNIHMNGASFFFIFMYIHMARGMYYHSFSLMNTWMLGVSIFMISMLTAFMGYVLPWGQMSFWGATVITNLISSIPYIGLMTVEWIWGGFSINNSTLNRFFTFHFILPFIISMLVLMHLMTLHSSGSNNPLGINSNLNKIPFHSYFTLKDMLGFLMFLILFMIINLQHPYIFSDPDNFIKANPMITPTHIQPEWYFLFAYTILRSIPNKLGGVMALFLSIMILYTLPWNKYKMNSNNFYPLNQTMFWLFINNFFMLTFLGSQMIEYPFINLSQMSSTIYFLYFLINHYTYLTWNWLINPLT